MYAFHVNNNKREAYRCENIFNYARDDDNTILMVIIIAYIPHTVCYNMHEERALCYTREFVSKMKFVFIFNVCIFRVHLFFESVAKAAQHIL